MKFLKKNFKMIIPFILGAILATGLTAYATYSYFADGVGYTRQGSDVENVEQALNELYGYIASGADYEIISNKVVAGADINNTYICEYIPRFFFMTVVRDDGRINWIYGANNCTDIMIWTPSATTPISNTTDFVIDSNGIRFNNHLTSYSRTLNIWIIK